METTFTEAQQKRIIDAGGMIFKEDVRVLTCSKPNGSALLGIIDYDYRVIDHLTTLEILALSCRWVHPSSLEETTFWRGFLDIEYSQKNKVLSATDLWTMEWGSGRSSDSFALLPGGLLISKELPSPYIKDDFPIYEVMDLIDYMSKPQPRTIPYPKVEFANWVFSQKDYNDYADVAISKAIELSSKRVSAESSK